MIITSIFKLKKEYEDTNPMVPVVRDGIKEYVEVTDEVRHGNYVFMIGNAQTAVEREQSVNKLFQLMGTPVFQTIVQRPEFPAAEFFKWVMDELNYRQTNTLTQALGIRGAIRQEGNARGIPEGQMGNFINDMERGIMGTIPEFANMLQEQQSDGQIPIPSEMVDQVKQNIVE